MPSQCTLKCDGVYSVKDRKIECSAEQYCQFEQPKKNLQKITPEQIAIQEKIQSAQVRIQVLRDRLKNSSMHAKRIETKLRSLSLRLKRGEAPLQQDYEVLTQLEMQYNVLGVAGKRQKKKK